MRTKYKLELYTSLQNAKKKYILDYVVMTLIKL